MITALVNFLLLCGKRDLFYHIESTSMDVKVRIQKRVWKQNPWEKAASCLAWWQMYSYILHTVQVHLSNTSECMVHSMWDIDALIINQEYVLLTCLLSYLKMAISQSSIFLLKCIKLTMKNSHHHNKLYQATPATDKHI